MFLVASGDGRRQHEEESAARRENRQDHAPRSAFPVDKGPDSRPRRGHPGAGLGRPGDLRVRQERGPVMRGNGRIFRRKGSVYLWCAYYLRGKEYRESTGTADQKKAEKFLQRRLKEVGADQIGAKPFGGPQQDRLTVNQLLDALEADYELRGKVTPQFGSHLARIRHYFGAVRATALSS